MEITVKTHADSGAGSLRQAIVDINQGSDSSNIIDLQIPNNTPIVLQSDLPLIKKNTTINSTGKQPVNGQGQYRLFATIIADLTLTNCNLDQGAAIGGNAHFACGGGLGAGEAFISIEEIHLLYYLLILLLAKRKAATHLGTREIEEPSTLG